MNALADLYPAHVETLKQRADRALGIVDRGASTQTSKPASRAASDVAGPIVAAGTPAHASLPTAASNACTADAEVNVTNDRSSRPSTKPRIASLLAGSATDR